MNFKSVLVALVLAFLPQVLVGQITINIGRDGPDATATISGDGKILVEGPFGIDVWEGQIPEWLVPDGIDKEFDVGNDGLEVPGAGNGQLAGEIVRGLAEVYLEILIESAKEAASAVITGLGKIFGF